MGFLGISYRLDRVLSGEPDDEQLDVWRVGLRRSEVTGENEGAWDEIASATFFGMDPGRNLMVGESPFDVADAYSADAAYYYERVFDLDGDLLPDVQQEVAWRVDRALFLHDVQVPVPLRRRGYGSLLVSDGVLTLATHGTAIFAHSGPLRSGHYASRARTCKREGWR